MTERTAEQMTTEIASAKASQALAMAHQARRRAGRAIWLAALALLMSSGTIATVIAAR